MGRIARVRAAASENRAPKRSISPKEIGVHRSDPIRRQSRMVMA